MKTMKLMKQIAKVILLIALIALVGLASYGYVRLNYSEGYKIIDLRKTWPKGEWMQVQFAESDGTEEAGIVFMVSPGNVKEFERRLKQEIKWSPKSYYPKPDWEQLRIVTTKGKYMTRIRISDTEISAENWRSSDLKKTLHDFGYRDLRQDAPVPDGSVQP